MSSVEKTARISVRRVSRHHVPSYGFSDHVPDEVIVEALAETGIAEDDPRVDEFRLVARNAGIMAARQLLNLDSCGITIEGEMGRKRYLVAVTPPPQGSNPVSWRP